MPGAFGAAIVAIGAGALRSVARGAAAGRIRGAAQAKKNYTVNEAGVWQTFVIATAGHLETLLAAEAHADWVDEVTPAERDRRIAAAEAARDREIAEAEAEKDKTIAKAQAQHQRAVEEAEAVHERAEADAVLHDVHFVPARRTWLISMSQIPTPESS